VSVSPASVVAGDGVSVFGSGFPSTSVIDLYLLSTPVLVGTTVSDASGAFRTTVIIPVGTSAGAHRIVAVVRGGTARAETPLTVIDPKAPVQAVPTSSTAPPRGQLSRTGSDRFPMWVGGGLLVIGLLMVGGLRVGEMRAVRSGIGRYFQHPPTG
jgi:hypothetical protein